MASALDGQISNFRRWLIQKLKESSWVVFDGDDVERISERLGVRAELLREARRSLDEDYERAGRQPVRLGQPHAIQQRGGRYAFDIVLPRAVYDDWTSYCKLREVPKGVLLRSVIHRMLSFPPADTGPRTRSWVYRGRRMKICMDRRGKRGRYLTSIVAEITPGSKQALVRRARALNVDPAALVREAMVDLLEGRLREVTILNSVSAMWDDPDRYFTGG